MPKQITLSDIKIKEIVIYEQDNQYIADVQYVVLDSTGQEWMTERVQLNDFDGTDRGTLTKIINAVTTKIKTRKQL